jgi:hypothetical protein
MTFFHKTLPDCEAANLARGMFVACKRRVGQVTRGSVTAQPCAVQRISHRTYAARRSSDGLAKENLRFFGAKDSFANGTMLNHFPVK